MAIPVMQMFACSQYVVNLVARWHQVTVDSTMMNKLAFLMRSPSARGKMQKMDTFFVTVLITSRDSRDCSECAQRMIRLGKRSRKLMNFIGLT